MNTNKPVKKDSNPPIGKELFEENRPVESWRIFKIMAEFVSGFEVLRRYGLAATFFGTARCQFGDKVYQNAQRLAGLLAQEGFTIITGGASGVMEAANRGAHEAGGNSVGLNIDLPNEQSSNQYTTDSEKFHYFFTRKVMLAFASEVYVFFPGGFGTLDEFFEIVTLVQTKKIKPVPIILIDREYWQPLLTWIEKDLYEKRHALNEEDTHIYRVADSIDEAYEVIMSLTKNRKEK